MIICESVPSPQPVAGSVGVRFTPHVGCACRHVATFTLHEALEKTPVFYIGFSPPPSSSTPLIASTRQRRGGKIWLSAPTTDEQKREPLFYTSSWFAYERTYCTLLR